MKQLPRYEIVRTDISGLVTLSLTRLLARHTIFLSLSLSLKGKGRLRDEIREPLPRRQKLMGPPSWKAPNYKSRTTFSNVSVCAEHDEHF